MESGVKHMSKAFKLHPKQEEAVLALGQNVIVSASAGAGKTSVLIQRLMKRILQDGLSVNEICALTFTEAAAGDMKIKLLESLNERLLEDPSSKEILEREISLVETAAITTIHSFCLSMIKDYGYILNIDPARADNILDPALAEIYKQKALNQTLQDFSREKPEDMMTLLNHLLLNPGYLEPLKDSILKTAGYLNSKPHLENTLTEIIALYTVDDFNLLPHEIKEAFFNHYKLNLQILKDNLDHYIDESVFIFESEGKPELLSPYNKLQDNVYQLLKMIENKDITFYQNLIPYLDIKLKSAPKAKHLANDMKALTQSINTVIKDALPLDEIFETIKDQKEIIDLILELSLLYLENYDALKESQSAFDFDDFEKYGLKILEAQEGVIAKIMQKRYKEIMVDEFQDTNDYQDSIIKLISTGDNIFRVGDVKQSIYQFRGAKPELMMNYLKASDIHKIPFLVNYRSSHNIVHYNNDLYRELMSYTEGFHYTEDDSVSAGNFKAKVNNPLVEMKLFTTKNYENEHDIKLLSKDINTLRAKLIAQEIIKLNEAGTNFKDITILIRTHAPKKYLKQAFESFNIPHFVDDMSGFFKSEVVSQVLAWLHYSINQDPYYLVSVLKSPFVGYDDNKIAKLKIENDDLKIALKIQDIETYNFIHTKISAYKHLDLLSVLVDLYNTNNTYHEKLSVQVKTNLDLLLEKATIYQQNNHASIIGFSQFIKEIDDERNSEAVALNDDEDVVRVMTWHQSKGLQYPVTFIWPTSRINQQDFNGRVLSDDLFGITLKDLTGPYHLERTSLYRHLSESIQVQKSVEEYLRLLYVATTRAEQKLIFLDVMKEVPQRKLNKHLLYNFSSSTDLIYPVSSTYIEKTVTDLNDVSFTPLNTPLVKPTHDVFTKRFELIEETALTPKSQVFEFNKNFVKAVEYGNTLHKLVETLPLRTLNEDDLKSVDPKFKQKLINYSQHVFTQSLYQADMIEREMPVLYRRNDQDTQGIIDFYAVFEDKVIIVDYKTDATDEETLIKRYTDQLDAYKKALNNIYPEHEIETYIYSFYNDDYIKL